MGRSRSRSPVRRERYQQDAYKDDMYRERDGDFEAYREREKTSRRERQPSPGPSRGRHRSRSPGRSRIRVSPVRGTERRPPRDYEARERDRDFELRDRERGDRGRDFEMRDRDRDYEMRDRERGDRDRGDSRRDRNREGKTTSSADAQKNAVPDFLMERKPIQPEDLEGKSQEEIEMMKLMGFGGFDTTKGKHVLGNDVSAVHLIQKRRYRQYMNRKGGFNRPLDFVA